jgi:hypothetical protein
VGIDVSACVVLADIAGVDDVPIVAAVLSDIGVDGDEFGVVGIADDIVATVAVVNTVDCAADNSADVVVGHTRASHVQLVVGFAEQSC